jgi:hypothetical protein
MKPALLLRFNAWHKADDSGPSLTEISNSRRSSVSFTASMSTIESKLNPKRRSKPSLPAEPAFCDISLRSAQIGVMWHYSGVSRHANPAQARRRRRCSGDEHPTLSCQGHIASMACLLEALKMRDNSGSCEEEEGCQKRPFPTWRFRVRNASIPGLVVPMTLPTTIHPTPSQLLAAAKRLELTLRYMQW